MKALSKGRRQNDKYRIRREIQTMKKNLAKRVIAFLCGSMMLAGLAGCSGSEKESMPANTASQGSAASQEGESTSGKLIDEPLEIELLFSGGDTIDPDGLIVQQIKEKTNVHLKLNGIPSDYATKRNTMLASNDIPDAVWCELSNIKQYAPMGMFLNLSDYEEDMPNYMSLINADDRKESTRVLYLEGNLYSFARLESYRVPVATAPMIRTDLLEKNNIPMPTTFEELFDALMKLKEAYPDKYMLSSRQGTNYLVGQFAYPLGSGGFPGFLKTNPMYYEPNEDSYLFGPIHENFKVVLDYLNRLYENKLLDPDYATNSEDAFKEKLANGSLLFYYDNNSHASQNYNPALQQVDPDAKIDYIPPMENSFGETRAYTYQKDWLERNDVVINAKVKRPHDVVKFFDWFYTEEGSLITNFGAEGETYVVEDGKAKIAPAMYEKFADTPKDALAKTVYKYAGGGLSFDLYRNESFMEECADPLFVEQGERISQGIAEGKIQYMRDDMVLLFTKEEQEELATLQANTLTVFNANIDKFITGDRPVSEFDAFVQELKDQGAEEMETIYNAAYSRMK